MFRGELLVLGRCVPFCSASFSGKTILGSSNIHGQTIIFKSCEMETQLVLEVFCGYIC